MLKNKYSGLIILIIIVLFVGYYIKDNSDAHFVVETATDEEMLTYNDASKYYVDGKLNINTADVTMLRTLEGIGEKTAQLIIDYRDKNGKFNSVDDLKNIKGLGDKKIDKIRNDICVK